MQPERKMAYNYENPETSVTALLQEYFSLLRGSNHNLMGQCDYPCVRITARVLQPERKVACNYIGLTKHLGKPLKESL